MLYLVALALNVAKRDQNLEVNQINYGKESSRTISGNAGSSGN